MDARALSRIFALGLTVAAASLAGCDEAEEEDGANDAGSGGDTNGDGDGDGESIAGAYCDYLLTCEGPPDPGYSIEDCVAYIDGLLATYAQEDLECHEAAEDYYACLGSLDCGDLDMVPDPCLGESDSWDDACGSSTPGSDE